MLRAGHDQLAIAASGYCDRSRAAPVDELLKAAVAIKSPGMLFITVPSWDSHSSIEGDNPRLLQDPCSDNRHVTDVGQ